MKVALKPAKEMESMKPTLFRDMNFLSMAQFLPKTKESGLDFAVVGKDVKNCAEVPNVMKPLMNEYCDVDVERCN